MISTERSFTRCAGMSHGAIEGVMYDPRVHLPIHECLIPHPFELRWRKSTASSLHGSRKLIGRR